VFKTLRGRLILSYAAIIVVCLGLAGGGALLFLRGYQRNASFSRLTDQADFAVLIANQLLQREGTQKQAVQRLGQLLNRHEGPKTHIYLLDEEGTVIAGSDDRLTGQRFRLPTSEERADDGQLGLYRGERRLGTGQRLLYVIQPIRSLLEPGQRPSGYSILLGEFYRPVLLAMGDLLPRLLWAGLIALGVSALLAAWLSHSIAQPLRRIALASENISAGNYGQNLEIAEPAEVARLAASFNQMADRVQHTLQAQQDLLANVSHELKTPLTSIQGFSQALLDGTAGEPAARQRAAAVIHEEAGRMRRLVDELLDLARLEAGEVTLSEQAIDVERLLSDCATRFAPRARELGCTITVDVAEPTGLLRGDPDRLDQVLDNLVDNALKHAAAVLQSGIVQLQGGRNERWVELSVTDNGPGISSGDLERVFERFYRVDKSRSRPSGEQGELRHTGTGLGLAISQQILRAHGGQLVAESVQGLGTRFTVRLPATE
jgi:signal transduction histidine kinase